MGLLFGGHGFDLGGSRVLSRAFGDVFEGRGLGSGRVNNPNPKPPLPSGQDRPASFHDRGARRAGDQPGSAGIVRPCALALPPGNRARRTRPEGTGSMALSMRAETVAPQTIAGGFVLVPVRQIMAAWRACRRSPLGVADFRTWLACREMRRQALHPRPRRGRPPTGSPSSHGSPASPPGGPAPPSNDSSRAGLLTWSDERHRVPRRRRPRTTTPWPTPSAAGRAPSPSRVASSDSWPAALDPRSSPPPSPSCSDAWRGAGGGSSPAAGSRPHGSHAPSTSTSDASSTPAGRAHRPRMDRPRARRPVGHESLGARLPHRPRLGPGRPPRGSAIATPSRPGRPPIATP